MRIFRNSVKAIVVCFGMFCSVPSFGQSFFKRGDSNVDGSFDISDAINTLGFLFLGNPPSLNCRDATDSNDDGEVDLSDAVYGLGFLFLGTQIPPQPFMECGPDPTSDELTCVSFSQCPQVPPETGITLATESQIYQVGQDVSGEIIITVDAPFDGKLEIFVINTRLPEGLSPPPYEQSMPITLSQAQTHRQKFSFNANEEGRHAIVAHLKTGNDIVEETVHDIGVRPDYPGLPDTLLYAQLHDVNVSSVLTQLETSADTDTEAVLNIGPLTIPIQVQRQQLYAPSAEIPPALDGVVSFYGKIAGVDESVVSFTLALGQDEIYGMILRNPDEVLWIEPLQSFDPMSPLGPHIFYDSKDDLSPERTDVVEIRPMMQGVGASSHVDTNTQYRDITIRVHEHYVSDQRTRSRRSIIADWAAIMRNEFRNIVPRESITNCITVNNIVIESWLSITSSGYGNNCSDNLAKFARDFFGVNNRLYVLFTDRGSDCGGIAYLGQGNSTQWHSITRDVYSHQYNVAIVAQETGHNLDWHSSWNPHPHDPHLDVSERWNHEHCWTIFCWNHVHCTVMRASYDGCEEAEWRYRRNSDTGLRHLAEGIVRYFPGLGPTWSQATINTSNSTVETLLDIPNLGGVRDTGNPALNRTLSIYSNSSIVEYSLQHGATYTQGEVPFNGSVNITFPHYTSFMLTIYRHQRIGWVFARENDNTLSGIVASTESTGGILASVNSVATVTGNSATETLLDIPGFGGVRDIGDNDPSTDHMLTVYSGGGVIEYAIQYGPTYVQGEVPANSAANVAFPHYSSFTLNIWRYGRSGWIFGKENDNQLAVITGSTIQGCSQARIGRATAVTSDNRTDALMDIPGLGGVRDTGNSSLNRTITIYSNSSIVEYAVQFGATNTPGEAPAGGSVNITFPHYTSFRLNIARHTRSGWMFCRENDNILTCVFAKSH